MELFIDNTDLILLNNGKPTRHNPINCNFSAINLSMSTPNIAPDIEWDTLTSYNGSDHWPIILKLYNSISQLEIINKWRLKNPKWEHFSSLVDQALLSSELGDINPTTPNIDQYRINDIVSKLTTSIIEAATVTIGKSNRTPNQKIDPWWNEEYKTYIRKYKKALNCFKRTKLLTDHILLKKVRAESKYILKKIKPSLGNNSQKQLISTPTLLPFGTK
jgi:hypothetical protein